MRKKIIKGHKSKKYTDLDKTELRAFFVAITALSLLILYLFPFFLRCMRKIGKGGVMATKKAQRTVSSLI